MFPFFKNKTRYIVLSLGMVLIFHIQIIIAPSGLVTIDAVSVTEAGFFSDLKEAFQKITKSTPKKSPSKKGGTLKAGQTGKLIGGGRAVKIDATGKTYSVTATYSDAAKAGADIASITGRDSYKVYRLRDIATGEIVGYTAVARDIKRFSDDTERDRDRPRRPTRNSVDLVPIDISFIFKDNPDQMVDQQMLTPNSIYIPQILVENQGCLPTNYPGYSATISDGRGGVTACRQTSSVFANYPPFGENGTFPVRLRIDFNSDGVFEYSEYQNNIGPIEGNDATVILFPEITIPEGEHTIEVSIDISDSEDQGNGCSEIWGCINENNNEQNNILQEQMRVFDPYVTIGSYLLNDTRWSINRTERFGYPSDVRLGNRDIITGDVVGLYWVVDGVDTATCTGRTSNSKGISIFDFNGQKDIRNVLVERALKTNKNYDVNITEPSEYDYHLYTISCKTDNGSTVTDNIVINNGATVYDLIPSLKTITVQIGEEITQMPFTILNISDNLISGFRYKLYIDSINMASGLISREITKDTEQLFKENVVWKAPDVPMLIPTEICVTPVGGGVQRCAESSIRVIENITQCSDGMDNDGDALIDMNDPGCDSPSDDSEAQSPILTVNPSIVRRGSQVTVTWDQVSPICVLSNQLQSEDATVPGFANLTVNNQTTITLTCGNQSESVTITVLPELYES